MSNLLMCVCVHAYTDIHTKTAGVLAAWERSSSGVRKEERNGHVD